MNPSTHPDCTHRLSFGPLGPTARPLVFDCDVAGRVDLDRLDRRERADYLYARALIGRDYRWPRVVAAQGGGQ
jgi:hypothetical protein